MRTGGEPPDRRDWYGWQDQQDIIMRLRVELERQFDEPQRIRRADTIPNQNIHRDH